MNENGLSWRRLLATLACAWLVVALVGPSLARGATVRRFALNPQQARLFQNWSNYLAQGPTVWSTTRPPAFTPQVRATIWEILRTDTQQQQLENPMIEYLLWRRSLNPARFTANHPSLSPALAQLLSAPPVPTTTPAPQVPAPQSGSSPSPTPLIPPAGQSVSPQNVAPPAVPEPGSLILAAGMIGWGLWWRRRIQRSARN